VIEGVARVDEEAVETADVDVEDVGLGSEDEGDDRSSLDRAEGVTIRIGLALKANERDQGRTLAEYITAGAAYVVLTIRRMLRIMLT
jgi:hypothetical protein